MIMTHSLRAAIGAAVLAAAPAWCGETKFWQQDEMVEFEKGDIKKLSLRSDGRLSLAPKLTELFDPSTAFLWGLARDSKGVLYCGGGVLGGTTTKLFAVDASGKGRVAAEVGGLAIQAVAVDAQDRVFFATSPDGKVYRLGAQGKAEVFYDPKAKYIWSLAAAGDGALYVATGDQGEIHRVAPDGSGGVFFRSEETHVRTMAFDRASNLIAGTDPNGLVIRVTPQGEGFVLYQTAKREVTAVAIGPDGVVYAGASGTRGATPVVAPVPVTPAPSAGPTAVAIPQPGTIRSAAPAPPPLPSAAPTVAGGSDVYGIQPDGYARRVWSHAQDIVYSIAFDAQGRPLVSTGNRGNIYRLDRGILYTLLLHLPPSQVTGLLSAPDGRVWAVTGNIGKVYQFGPGQEESGTVESEVLDAGAFTYFGRMRFQGKLNGGVIKLETRTGNLNRAQRNWSPWTAVPLASSMGRIASPAARFLQYRATLTGAPPGGVSPELSLVEIAYQARNTAPRVEIVEVTPQNYKFPVPSLGLIAGSTLNLPPIGKKQATPAVSLNTSANTPPMSPAKGHIGVRWLAVDDNGDSLLAKIEIRGIREAQWKLVKDRVREGYYSWDATSLPDGEYVARVTVSDEPSNPPDQALSGSLESEPFLIDNTPPEISNLRASPRGSKLEIRWSAKDALNVIGAAEYSINGGEWRLAQPTTLLSDSLAHDYVVLVERPAGEVTIAVRVSDELDNQAAAKIVVP